MGGATGREAQLSAVGDFGRLGAWPALSGACTEGSSASVGEKKGVVTPPRQSARNRLAMDLNAEDLSPNRRATWSSEWPSTKIARRASYRCWKVGLGSRKNRLV